MASSPQSLGHVMGLASRLIGAMTSPIIIGFGAGFFLVKEYQLPAYTLLIGTGIGIGLGFYWLIKDALALSDPSSHDQ